jgi:hypothetical protein
MATNDPKVEFEPAPPSAPSETSGPLQSATKAEKPAIQVLLALGERLIYLIVVAMLVLGAWVNWWVAYGHADSTVLPRFTADAEFLLAAGAIALIAFELRKERLENDRLESARRSAEGKTRDR